MKCPYCLKELPLSIAGAAMGSIKSEKKAMSSKANGLCPCHAGKKRGRPLKKLSAFEELKMFGNRT
jgi:hypothetical protein